MKARIARRFCVGGLGLRRDGAGDDVGKDMRRQRRILPVRAGRIGQRRRHRMARRYRRSCRQTARDWCRHPRAGSDSMCLSPLSMLSSCRSVIFARGSPGVFCQAGTGAGRSSSSLPSLDQLADQRRGDRLGHRPGHEAIAGAIARRIAFIDAPAVLPDDDGAGFGQRRLRKKRIGRGAAGGATSGGTGTARRSKHCGRRGERQHKQA